MRDLIRALRNGTVSELHLYLILVCIEVAKSNWTTQETEQYGTVVTELLAGLAPSEWTTQ